MPRPYPSRRLRPLGALPRPDGSLSDLGFTLLVAGALAGLEVAGRFTRGDPEDAVVLLALFLLAQLVRLRHRRAALPWVAWVREAGGRAAEAVRRRTVVLGVDLRESGPLPARFPPLLGAAAAAASTAALLLAVLPPFDLREVREAVRTVSSLAWILASGGAWAMFVGGGYFLLFLTFALTHDGMVRAHAGPGPRSRRAEFLAFGAWTVAILGAWVLLPPRGALAIHAAWLGLSLLALGLPGAPDVRLLWRPRGSPGPLRSVGWRAHILAGTAAVGLALAASVLFLHGPAAAGRPAPGALAAVFPVTLSMGALFAWTGAAALTAWCLAVVRIALLSRFRGPARPAPPVAFVANRLGGQARRAVRTVLGASGMGARFAPSRRRRSEVLLEVASEGTPPAPRPAGGPEPMRVPLEDLPSREVRRRIARRSQLVRRRLLVRGLERLFKKAAGRRFRQGTGFWVAPQHWFCIGLSRDEDERATDWKEGTFFLETVGPAYHRVFPREALQHLHEMMRSLEVDLVFVEDGVEFRRFRRVLRMAFEVYDMLGPGGRAEEIHFTGIPGVRVLLHEFDIEDPSRTRLGEYPEPDYESVGRARILHVFRDRGEAEEGVEAPSDRRGAPVLV